MQTTPTVSGNATASMPSMASPTASGSPIVFKPAAESDVGAGQFAGAFLICLVLLFCAIAVLRRFGGSRSMSFGAPRSVQLVESLRLADRMRVSLIRYRGRELLIAHADQTATVLANEPIVHDATESSS